MKLLTYNVYHQAVPKPTRVKDEFEANFILMGQLQAYTGAHAIDKGRDKYGVRHPVVHELDGMGFEVVRFDES